MRPGQRGFCFVREATDDGVVLTTWGRSSGYFVDPIEKKPLFHYLPGSSVLSFGTAGCNLGCRYCQNWDLSRSKEMDRMQARALPEDIAFTAREADCDSVAYTYNEPTIFAEYAIDTARACRERGIHSIAVTNGYVNPEPRRAFYAEMDAANIDLKGFTEGYYDKLCLAELGPVLDTIEYAANATDCWVELTTLLIPGDNDSDVEIEAESAWIREHVGPDVPLHFTAFHPSYRMMDTAPTPHATLVRARQIALSHGLHFVYVGNVLDREGSSTWCPGCGALLVERIGYQIGAWGLDEHGACARCGRPLPGVFGGRPLGYAGMSPYPIEISAAPPR